MKCPKCHYLSFDPEPRCKNCGFSLGLAAPDLPMSTERGEEGPLADLELRTVTPPAMAAASADNLTLSEEPATAVAPPVPEPKPVRRIPVPRLDRPRARLAPEERATATSEPVSEPVASSPEVPAPTPTPTPARRAVPPTTELPLFVKGMSESPAPEMAVVVPVPVRHDAPVAEPSIASRMPVRPAEIEDPFHEAVRAIEARSDDDEAVAAAPPVPIVTAARTLAPSEALAEPVRRTIGPLDHDLLNGVERLEKNERRKARAAARAVRLPDAAGAGRRLGAAVVDGLLLSGILVGLFALTLRWTALEWTDVATLATWQTAAFLMLVASGYLLLFTAAAGQTPGKMLVGIRVVGAGTNGEGTEPLSPGQACLRELMAVPAVLMLGLGFLPALMGAERGLHDRIASTRVVRG